MSSNALSPKAAFIIQAVSQQIAYRSVFYLFSLVMCVLLYPIAKTFIAPLANLIVPLAETSLLKTIMVMTVMYWLPIIVKQIVWIKKAL